MDRAFTVVSKAGIKFGTSAPIEPNLSRARSVYMSELDMSPQRTDVPYGTLDLLILKTLDTMGAMHGYSLARRIEQISETVVRLSQGSIYPAVIRLEQQGWIKTEWGISETNRKVKFYRLTAAGTRQLRVKLSEWEDTVALVTRFLEAKS